MRSFRSRRLLLAARSTLRRGSVVRVLAGLSLRLRWVYGWMDRYGLLMAWLSYGYGVREHGISWVLACDFTKRNRAMNSLNKTLRIQQAGSYVHNETVTGV
jgi:hypothetical protein